MNHKGILINREVMEIQLERLVRMAWRVRRKLMGTL